MFPWSRIYNPESCKKRIIVQIQRRMWVRISVPKCYLAKTNINEQQPSFLLVFLTKPHKFLYFFFSIQTNTMILVMLRLGWDWD